MSVVVSVQFSRFHKSILSGAWQPFTHVRPCHFTLIGPSVQLEVIPKLFTTARNLAAGILSSLLISSSRGNEARFNAECRVQSAEFDQSLVTSAATGMEARLRKEVGLFL
jgi:hypothetical protein